MACTAQLQPAPPPALGVLQAAIIAPSAVPVAINAKVVVAGASGPIHAGPAEPSALLHLAAPPKCEVPLRHRECSAPLVKRVPRPR